MLKGKYTVDKADSTKSMLIGSPSDSCSRDVTAVLFDVTQTKTLTLRCPAHPLPRL